MQRFLPRFTKKHSLFLFVFLYINYGFSQQDVKSTFNESYWNAYADKVHLSGKERIEFISSHQKQNSPAPNTTTNSPLGAAKFIPIDPQNNIFAGPCINADFELGNLTGWNVSSGFHPGFNPTGCCPNGGGQQTIMGVGVDPYGGFPVVFPGGNFSLKLGDNVNGGEADRISQTFLVSPANANFSYKYAVVLEDPNHPQNQQPSFQVEMLDSNNVQIPCTYFYVAAGQGIPGFFNSPTPGVIYKPWTTVLVDLSPYIGQNVTIVFTTYDCSLGGHFGYAYIDGVCQSFVGGGSDTVCAGATNTFCAPVGLASYTWNGPGVVNSVGQCLNTTLPGIYTVQTTLITNCNGPTFTYTRTDQPVPVPASSGNATVCANNSFVFPLTGTITGYPATPNWITAGDGVFSAPTGYTTSYTPGPNDISAGFVNLNFSTLNNGVCPPSNNTLQVLIIPSPVVNAGPSQTLCSNVPAVLNATVSGPTTTGIWSTSGTGAFNPSPAFVTATYVPSPADILAGSVTLTLTSTFNGYCNAVSSTVSLSFVQIATVTALAPQNNICSNAGTFSLTGTIIGATPTGSWSTNGNGTFNPGPGQINTTYSFTPADVGMGTIIFTLSSTNNGVCSSVSNTIAINITPISTVSAGGNQIICSTTGTVGLSGNVTPGYPTWGSSGTGTFLPNSSVINPIYAFSPADIVAGSVTFTLFSNGNAPCPIVQDTVKIPVQSLAVVNAGPSQSICATANTINLSGNITGATNTGFWTTNGNGIFSPTPATVNTTYSFTPTDVLAGSIIFTLTSTNNGPCPATSNTLSLSFFTLAIVNAGPNQIVCSNAGTIGLNGSSTNMGNWTSNGVGTFSPNNTFLNTTYSITPADILSGLVSFTFSSANNGACPVVRDSVMMRIKRLATVNAGPSQLICSSTPTVSLAGNITGGTNTGVWSTDGAGGFNPSANSLSNIYNVTPADIITGNLTFTLTSTNNSPCPAVTDTMRVSIFDLPVVNAGPNQALCSNQGTIALTGNINSLNGTGVWSSNGSGLYYPFTTSINTTYFMSQADINAGILTFTLTSTNNGPCPNVTDSVRITIRKIAVVTAGPDKTVCSTNLSIPINGGISGGVTTGAWTHDGAGTVLPNNTAMAITYSAVPQDVTKGLVTLILTSSPNGVCPIVKDTARIIIRKNPVIRLGQDTSICSYQNPLRLEPNISGDIGQLIWNTNGLGFFTPNALVNPTSYDITRDAANGFVVLSVSALNNGPCLNASSTISVAIHPTPTANFNPSTFTTSVPRNPVTFQNQSKNATSYFWNFGDGSSSGAVSPKHYYNAVGYYTITLVAYNQYGCSDTTSHEILAVSDIEFPNVFTPNLNGSNGGAYDINDYSNDVFFPYASGVTEYNLKIFNRWGELIFESNDIKTGWDGYFNNKLCQQDAYVWKANVKFFDGKTYNKTGSVTLLR